MYEAQGKVAGDDVATEQPASSLQAGNEGVEVEIKNMSPLTRAGDRMKCFSPKLTKYDERGEIKTTRMKRWAGHAHEQKGSACREGGSFRFAPYV